jgi:hypothetical protein
MKIETEVKEFANILDVPVLTAGEFVSHNAGPLVVTEEDLDEIVEGSNRLQPLITEAIDTGVYRGNEGLSSRLSRPIPGLLNLKHQQIFPETIKEAVSRVTTSFRKAAINGKNWIIQQFQNVPDDIAKTLAEEFPFRSVELLPLTDPNTGVFNDKIIRSTAFLDRFTPPAVPGQSPELIVEFAGPDDPLIVITTHQNIQGGNNMEVKAQIEQMNVAELAAMQATLTDQKTMIDALNAKIDSVEEARQEAVELAIQNETQKDAKIAELQAVQDLAESDRMISELSGKVRKYGDQVFMVSPAFLEVISSSIQNKGAIELAEGENLRQGYVKLFETVIDLAGKHAILVPIETQGLQSHADPTEEKKELIDQATELSEKEGIPYGDAWVKVMGNQQGGK